MARGVNRVTLIGNLGQDPDIRFTQNQKQVANVSIATSESWTDKNTGQKQEKTEWHRVVFFDRLAEIVGQYLKKGSKVYIEGKLQTRKWQNQQGVDQYTTEIVANEMQMLDSNQTPAQNQGDYSQSALQQGYAQPAPAQPGYQQPAPQQPPYSTPPPSQQPDRRTAPPPGTPQGNMQGGPQGNFPGPQQ